MAAEEEKDIETHIKLIKTQMMPTPRPSGSHRSPYAAGAKPMARTFMAHYENPHTAVQGYQHFNHEYGGSGFASAATNPNNPPDSEVEMVMEQFNLLQLYTEGQGSGAQCFLSPAESALRNASGVASPIECWGCSGYEVHHATRFHSFRDCPNKYDPDVRSQAFKRMKQMREEWDSRKRHNGTSTGRKRESQAMLTRAEAVRDWQNLGFNSRTEAETAADAVALMATNMSARNRKNLGREWTRKVQDNANTNQDQDGNDTGNYYGPATRTRQASQHQTYHFIARIFQALPLKSLPLEISPTLPHCDFPIGPTHDKGKLKVAVDSCAGVNIGHLEFHQAMANTFPELVESFKTMQEYGKKTSTLAG